MHKVLLTQPDPLMATHGISCCVEGFLGGLAAEWSHPTLPCHKFEVQCLQMPHAASAESFVMCGHQAIL